MAVQFNQVIICGNLGSDPFYKVLDNGRYFTSFRLFTNRSYFTKGNDGVLEKKEATDAPTVQCWGKNAERMAKFLKKGRNVMVIGHIETHSWDDPNNPDKKLYNTVIMADDFKFLDAPRREAATQENDAEFEPDTSADAIKDVEI